MKQVKIFLASSIVEFEHERNELISYIHRLNEQYVKRGVFFDLVICENASNAMAATRKQDEYNEAIRSSQYVYVLVGDRMGAYTEEEFDVALDQFSRTGSPAIYTYFKRLPEGSEPDESVTRFVERLGEGLGHYYSEFDSVDSIKLNMIMELTRDPEVGGELRFQDGRAKVDGVEMMSVEGLPSYGGNEDLAAKRAEIRELERRHADIKLELSAGFDERLLEEAQSIANQRTKLEEEVKSIEDAVLMSCNLIMDASKKGEADWREEEARSLVNEGKYKQAQTMLFDRQWDQEIARKNEIGDSLRESVAQYISGKRLYAICSQARGMDESDRSKVIEAYEAALAEACRWGVDLSIIYDYASFLSSQRLYNEAEPVVKRYLAFAHAFEETARNLFDGYVLAYRILSARRKFFEADANIKKALELAECLELPEKDQVSLERANYASTRDVGASGDLTSILTSILERHEEYLSSDTHDAKSQKASLLYSLARRYSLEGKIDESAELHERVVAIREELAETGDESDIRFLIVAYNDYGYFFDTELGDHAKALQYHEKALEMRREGAERSPSIYVSGVARSLSHCASNLNQLGRMEEAERAIRESVQIRERLLREDPDMYTSPYAETLRNLGKVLQDKGDPAFFEEAEDSYRRSIDIFKKDFDSVGSKKFGRQLAKTLRMYAEFLDIASRPEEAERARVEADALPQ